MALRGGARLRRDGDRLTPGGTPAGGVVFRRGAEPEEMRTGHDLSGLLTDRARFDSR
ncbi:hypothetical protein GCM10010145_44750 [Streptomyces ruber]|uniref:Uncharacterized protein n=2 Tax=Streptomyces TaxID=1883 RepID=A0A918BI39_9ACTN|nr:hypothetical protein GCM10010145_44750 [Streptomyces ruber]